MKLKFASTLLFVQVAMVVGCDNDTTRVAVRPHGDLAGRFDRLVPELLAKHGVPGAQIAVIDDGAVVWHRNYGVADTNGSKPVTDETLFNVGSISKVVAAWAVMTLCGDNRDMNLDAPVQRHLTRWQHPETEFDVEQVTVRRLLCHTSGLSVFPASESLTYPPSLEETLSKSYGAFGQLRLVRPPGTDFEYNNGNYMILQLLVEELTGDRFSNYVRRTILEPLKMDSSGYAGAAVDRIATPFDKDGRPLPRYQTYHNEKFAASGGLYTTASDLAKFVAATMPGPTGALSGRTVLQPETVSLMITPAEETRGNYGLGYKMLPVSPSMTMIGHDGSNPGWRAGFMAFPKVGVGIVVLTNGDNGGAIVADIVCTWADWENEIELSGLCEGAKPIPAK